MAEDSEVPHTLVALTPQLLSKRSKAAAYEPAVQPRQVAVEVAAKAVEYKPDPHGVHAEAIVPAKYEPAGQLRQL